MRLSSDELLADAHVVALPLVVPFRGLQVREAMLLRGPHGWSEFSPFDDYSDEECVSWLRATIEFGWQEMPSPLRMSVPVNASVPAVDPAEVVNVLSRFDGCRTAKVKVGGPLTTRISDVERVRTTREVLGPEGRIRVDANGAWNVDEAEHAIRDLAEFDLEYVEQPCATIPELAQIRERISDLGIPIAADESIRREADPFAVARASAADILVLKVAPLGGIARCREIVEVTGLPAVVSSALETSVGIAMGAHLAARLDTLEFDCGLATASLFEGDVVEHPLVATAGHIPVSRPNVSTDLLERHAASAERTQWWRARLARVAELL